MPSFKIHLVTIVRDEGAQEITNLKVHFIKADVKPFRNKVFQPYFSVLFTSSDVFEREIIRIYFNK